MSFMSETMQSQPEQLRGMLADTTGVDAAAERLRGRRLYLVGTGTSWHAANIGAWFLRAAGVEAWPVQAMDAVLYGPRPAGGEGLVLLSHKGTKTYTMQMLERARAEGVPTAVISGQGAPGAEIETSVVERSAAYTASHTGAMLRLAQLATALGADLGPLNGVPDAVAEVVEGPAVGVVSPAAGDGVRGRRPQPVDGGRGRAEGEGDRLRRVRGDGRGAVPARPIGGRRQRTTRWSAWTAADPAASGCRRSRARRNPPACRCG